MLTKLAVKYLAWQLRKNRLFWEVYKSNIAMVIYDGVKAYFPLTTKKSSPTLLEFCNICAGNFLKLWTQGKIKNKDWFAKE